MTTTSQTTAHHAADRSNALSAATDASDPVAARWKAEWEGSAKLQEEYPTAGGYVAIMKRQAMKTEMAAGYGPGATTAAVKASPETEARWKADWEASPKLQEEYPTAGSYVAIKKREAR